MAGTGIEWEAPPPEDPVGASKSAVIDAWLRDEHLQDIAQRSRTLILSPEGEPFEGFRKRVLDYVGDQVELSDGRTTKILTDSFSKADKKRMGGMEPSVLIFAIDLGADADGDDSKLLTRMTKAMSHFLFVSRHLGLGDSCAVVVIICRLSSIAKSLQGPAQQSWERLYPTLREGESLKSAIDVEFEAAANSSASPLQVKMVFDENGCEDLSFLRGVIQEAVDAVMQAFKYKTGQREAEERFHDATGTGMATSTSAQDQQEEIHPKTRREVIHKWMPGLVFVLQVVILFIAFVAAMPWDAITKMIYLILDILHVPRLF